MSRSLFPFGPPSAGAAGLVAEEKRGGLVPRHHDRVARHESLHAGACDGPLLACDQLDSVEQLSDKLHLVTQVHLRHEFPKHAVRLTRLRARLESDALRTQPDPDFRTALRGAAPPDET